MNFNKAFKPRIPSREKWALDYIKKLKHAISIFTNESKTVTGTGSGTFSGDLNFSVSFRLLNTCTTGYLRN